MEGYEYQVEYICEKTGKPYVSPISWHGRARIPGKPGGGKNEYEIKPKPLHSTCVCCPAIVTEEWILNKKKPKSKKNKKKK